MLQALHWGPNTRTLTNGIRIPTPPLARWVPRHTCRGIAHTPFFPLFPFRHRSLYVIVIARDPLNRRSSLVGREPLNRRLSPVVRCLVVSSSTGDYHSLVVSSSTGDYHPSFAVPVGYSLPLSSLSSCSPHSFFLSCVVQLLAAERSAYIVSPSKLCDTSKMSESNSPASRSSRP